MPRTRRRFTSEFKNEVVRLAEGERPTDPAWRSSGGGCYVATYLFSAVERVLG